MLSSLFGSEITILNLGEVSEESIHPRAIVVSTIEATTPLFSTISENDLKRVQILTNSASKILWITKGHFVSGNQPDHALIRGIAGPLMLEQPALHLQIFDIDDSLNGVDVTAQNVRRIVQSFFSDTVPEPEVAQKGGVLHALQWEPEDELNAQFDLKQRDEVVETRLSDVGRCNLSIKEPGQMETIHFTTEEFEGSLPADHVEIHIKSIGLNAKVMK
jgi:hypothetical protein